MVNLRHATFCGQSFTVTNCYNFFCVSLSFSFLYHYINSIFFILLLVNSF